MHQGADGGQEQACGPSEERAPMGAQLYWIGLLRETEEVIREERVQHVTRAIGRWELVAQRPLCFTKTVGNHCPVM